MLTRCRPEASEKAHSSIFGMVDGSVAESTSATRTSASSTTWAPPIRAVDTAKYRLHKKLGCEESTYMYLQKFL